MVLLDTGTPGTSREIFSEDANCNYKPSILAIELYSCIAQWLEHSICNRGVASSSPIIDNTFCF